MMAPSCVRRTRATVAATLSISAATTGSAATERRASSRMRRVADAFVGRTIRRRCSSTVRTRRRLAKGWSAATASTISST